MLQIKYWLVAIPCIFLALIILVIIDLCGIEKIQEHEKDDFYY